MTLLLFHGQFSTGDMLLEDCGLTGYFPSWYWTRSGYRIRGSNMPVAQWLKGFLLPHRYSSVDRRQTVIVGGYSKGAEVALDALKQLAPLRAPFICYESKAMPTFDMKIPSLVIWNKRGKGSRRRRAKVNEAWQQHTDMTALSGAGRHVEKLRHGWDQGINNEIVDWTVRA